MEMVSIAGSMVTLSLLYGLLIFSGNDESYQAQATPLQETNQLPLVINTWFFSNATAEGFNTLSIGGSSVDAVVAGCTVCEVNQCDGSVGYGNHPDENGETTLDAMVMDGNTHDVGAVGSLRGVKSAIAVARYVLDYTTHTLLVGSQATQFASEMGFLVENLTTEASASGYQNWLNQDCQPNFWINVTPSPTESCGPYLPLNSRKGKRSSRSKSTASEKGHDTIGMIAIDGLGKVACGTSTNGANHKIPGRVGDSPIAGSGCFADKNVGAAAATGDGDILMRFLPSLVAVEKMRAGLGPEESATQALEQIAEFYPDYEGALVVATKEGLYGAACYGFSNFQYSFQLSTMSEPEVVQVPCS